MCVCDQATFESHKFYSDRIGCSVENGWRGRRGETKRPVKLIAAVRVSLRGSWNEGGGIKCREKGVTLRATYLSEPTGLGDVLGMGSE